MKVTSGTGPFALTYELRLVGKDVHILVYGGEAHVGSVSVGDHGEVTTWVGKNHRDDALSEPLAKAVSEEFGCICSVSAGFHIDDLKTDEILQVVKNNQEGIEKVMMFLRSNRDGDQKSEGHPHE